MVNVPLELLKLYFQLGLHYKEIVWILAHNHGIIISLRHLKRKLRELGLYRRKQWTNYCEVVAFLKKELQASGQLHGYRMMHAKCISNGLEVRKEDVRLILSLLDPAGVQSRRSGRLRRRAYYAVFGTFSETPPPSAFGRFNDQSQWDLLAPFLLGPAVPPPFYYQ